MEIYNLTEDLKVFGFEVTSFPNGVGEAFDRLVKMLPQGDERPYYGFFEMTKNGMSYKAAALQTFAEEAEKYGLKTYTIEKGEYLSETVNNWMEKTACIKDVFEQLMKDNRADATKPGVEIYKSMTEMMCLVKVDKAKEVFSEFEKAANDFSKQFSLCSEEQINVVPFEGSWTAAQVAEHVRKSYELIAGLIAGPAKPTGRDPEKK